MTLNPDDLRVESFDTGGPGEDAAITSPVYKCTANPAHHSACYVCYETDRTMCYASCELTCVVCSRLYA